MDYKYIFMANKVIQHRYEYKFYKSMIKMSDELGNNTRVDSMSK